MEIISLSGYTEEEKYEIAKRHLVPKQIEENGLKKDDVKFDRKALTRIISEYTQEAGLRQLEREIGKVSRKIARQKAKLETEFAPVRVTAETVKDYLRSPKIFPEEALKTDQIGTGYRTRVDGGRRRYFVYRAVENKRERQIAADPDNSAT